MVKAITKIGNSQGIIFDAALMELAHLKVGDNVNLTIHEGGSLMITPIKPVIDATEATKSAQLFIKDNDELFHRLSK